MAKVKKIKVKSRSAAKKRFRKTGGSAVKIKHAKAGRRHLLTKKSESRKRGLKKTAYVGDGEYKAILAMLPY